MGNLNSSSMKNMVTSFNNNMNQQMINIAGSNTQTCQSDQNITVYTGQLANGTACTFQGQNLNVGQQIGLACTANATFNNQVTSQATTLIQNALNQTAADNQAASAAFLSTAVNANISNIKTQADLINYITSITDISATSNCTQYSSTNQGQNVYLCGVFYPPSTINLTQNTSLQATSSCIATNVIDAIQSNTDLNTALQAADNQQKAATAGISSLWTWVIVIVIAFLVVVVIAILVNRKPKQQYSAVATTGNLATPGIANTSVVPLGTSNTLTSAIASSAVKSAIS